MRAVFAAVVTSMVLLLTACGSGETVTVLAAGDIAHCESDGDEQTAALLAAEEGTVLTLGDNAYDDGSDADFANCYEPSWGQEKERTYPSAGNHEYDLPGADGYFNYFGERAGDPNRGYYSFDLGEWHFVALNSNCDEVGGCHAGSLQEEWLRGDLEASSADCTLAYFHHPLFSSGSGHGNNPQVQALWEVLYDARADIVLSGHDHNYERFAPQTPEGELDEERGIRQFVIGTGGRSLRELGELVANSEVFDSSTYGVLELTLKDGDYDWEFLPAGVGTFTDSGSDSCH